MLHTVLVSIFSMVNGVKILVPLDSGLQLLRSSWSLFLLQGFIITFLTLLMSKTLTLHFP